MFWDLIYKTVRKVNYSFKKKIFPFYTVFCSTIVCYCSRTMSRCRQSDCKAALIIIIIFFLYILNYVWIILDVIGGTDNAVGFNLHDRIKVKIDVST